MTIAKRCQRVLLSVALVIPTVLQAAEPLLPAEVLAFVREREGCDHWRGEGGYDAERIIEINRGVCRTCTGTDRKLADLKARYAQDGAVMKLLSPFEPRIELMDKREAEVNCRSADAQYFKLLSASPQGER